jgi:hypothetical protein
MDSAAQMHSMASKLNPSFNKKFLAGGMQYIDEMKYIYSLFWLKAAKYPSLTKSCRAGFKLWLRSQIMLHCHVNHR